MREPVAVLPTFNEIGNIDRIVHAIRGRGVAVLVVDDNSSDGTAEAADALAADDPGVTVVHRPQKLGLGPAYAHGFGLALDAGHDIICQMDADFSHDPADLPRLIDRVRSGSDLVIGSRYVPGGSTPDWPLGRRILSSGGNLYARALLGGSVRDLTGGFRAWSAPTLRHVDASTCQSSGYAFQVEMAWRALRAGRSVAEVPIVFRERQVGSSKMSPTIAVEAMGLVTSWGFRRLLRRH